MRSIVCVCVIVMALTGGAAAQPGVFGGCPRGPLRGVDDEGAIVETVFAQPAELRRCKPKHVRGGKAKGEPTCVRDEAAEAAGIPALGPLEPAAGLGHTFIREKGKHWTLISFRAGRRQLALWRSDMPVDCVGRMFLSPDRRTLVVEVTLSKKFFMDERETLRVIVLRLPRPVS